MGYLEDRRKLLQGWNTWDTYSALTYAYLPDGYGIRIGWKEYLRGQYLQYVNVGGHQEQEVTVCPGIHAYDGSYTELEFTWARLRFRVETASEGKNLVVRIKCLKNDTRFVPSAVIECVRLWNSAGAHSRKKECIHWETCGSKNLSGIFVIKGILKEEPYVPLGSPYLCLSLEDEVLAGVGEQKNVEQARQLLEEKRGAVISYAVRKYEGLAEEWLGMQKGLAWNLIYDPGRCRPMINVSRVWNVDRGGFAAFGWDNFFLGYMTALDVPALGRVNILENLKEVKQLGFVPNGVFGNGRKTFDRSQPPVGSMCVREVYRLEPADDFLKEAFEPLLIWNRWWAENRMEEGMLSWGSDEYDNCWEMPGIHENFGAAMESGMDNSPMYLEEEALFDPETGILKLWDVALNSLYIYDCEVLADIARVLGRNEEMEELLTRSGRLKEGLKRLWNEELGIYCNFRTDIRRFSIVLTPCSFYPLLTGVPDRKQFDRMIKEHFFNTEEFWGEWVLPSVSKNHPMYAENDYWKGRIWAPINFLVYMGLRRYGSSEARTNLAEKSRQLFMREMREHGHIHENYSAVDGYGDDVKNSDNCYAWGGLLAFISLIEKGYSGNVGDQIYE